MCYPTQIIVNNGAEDMFTKRLGIVKGVGKFQVFLSRLYSGVLVYSQAGVVIQQIHYCIEFGSDCMHKLTFIRFIVFFISVLMLFYIFQHRKMSQVVAVSLIYATSNKGPKTGLTLHT